MLDAQRILDVEDLLKGLETILLLISIVIFIDKLFGGR